MSHDEYFCERFIEHSHATPSSGAGTPQWRGNWQNSIDYGPYSLTATTYYVSGYKAVGFDQFGTMDCNGGSTYGGEALFQAIRKVSEHKPVVSVIGTLGAIQVPVVGWGPLKSLEQLGPLAIFVGMQVLEVAAVQKRKRGLTNAQALAVLLKAALPVLVVASAVVVALHSRGHFGPFSSRVRGLFVKHTRTGNPLVDSVAEHQPANEQAYQHYLHHVYDIAPYGFGASFLTWRDANPFVILYACSL